MNYKLNKDILMIAALDRNQMKRKETCKTTKYCILLYTYERIYKQFCFDPFSYQLTEFICSRDCCAPSSKQTREKMKNGFQSALL